MRDAAPAPPVSRSATARDQRRWSTLAVVVVSILVVFLDGMVLNVALPRIQQELGASQGEQEWAVAAYTLVFAALLLPFGAVGDRLGRRRILTAGLAVFGAASAVAAYAGSPIELILMRAVMGVGAAAILPSTLAIITNTFDEDERGRAIAIWAAASGLAVPLGPLVGGAMLDAGFWWGSVLLINVPIVLVALVGVRRLVPESRDPTEPEVDRLGVLLSVAGLGLLVYGVIRAGQTTEWTSRATIGAIAGGIALLVVFVWLEATSNHAALDVRWFRQPALATASGAMALAMFALFGAMLYGIYYLQFDRGYSPLGAGVLLLGNAAAVVVFAPLSAALAKRHGHRRVCATGLVVLAAAYAGMATIDPRYTHRRRRVAPHRAWSRFRPRDRTHHRPRHGRHPQGAGGGRLRAQQRGALRWWRHRHRRPRLSPVHRVPVRDRQLRRCAPHRSPRRGGRVDRGDPGSRRRHPRQHRRSRRVPARGGEPRVHRRHAPHRGLEHGRRPCRPRGRVGLDAPPRGHR
jgi:MFS family permease